MSEASESSKFAREDKRRMKTSFDLVGDHGVAYFCVSVVVTTS